jgi:hypothetical protein
MTFSFNFINMNDLENHCLGEDIFGQTMKHVQNIHDNT